MFTDIFSQILSAFTPYRDMAPRLLVALLLLIAGWILALIFYSLVLWLIEKLGVRRYIQKFSQGDTNIGTEDIGTLIAKSVAVFIFILLLRKAVVYLGFFEVERFLTDVINYLPSLFIAVLIGFFGIRFSKTVYGIVKQTSHFSDPQTANALAHLARISILFFTLMIALHYLRIVDAFVINTVLVGFVAMVSLAGGLAFGLGGQAFAEGILGNLKEGVKPNPTPKKRTDY